MAKPIRAWTFVPLLYFMQAMPVAIVQEVSTIIYKDLGVANADITRWTSLIAIPWSIKLLWGPLVDLNFTKRKWVTTMQGLITLVLMIVPWVLRLPDAFAISLGTLFVAAIFSATCDIATDGFYLLALKREEQSAYVGIQATFFRLGRLFCIGLLVMFAGMLMELPLFGGARVNWAAIPGSSTIILQDYQPHVGDHLIISRGQADEERVTAAAVMQTPLGTAVTMDKPITKAHSRETPVIESYTVVNAWTAILVFGALVYGIGWLLLGFSKGPTRLPLPEADVERRHNREETLNNIYRTVSIIALAFFAYFTLNSVVRLSAFGLYSALRGRYDLHGWALTPEQQRAEWIQLPLCAIGTIMFYLTSRKLLRGTEMADAFASFLRNRGIIAIFAFILFYRFGEAMVVKMTPLFLKDSPLKGGLGIDDKILGQINGIAGVVGIVVGGIAGGLVVSRYGLRRTFWPIVICMHLPNLLYVWASRVHPPVAYIYGVAFLDQAGYGFGFAGYQIYLMTVAQRGHYRTAHYAIASGLGALCIMIAGITSGIVYTNSTSAPWIPSTGPPNSFGYLNFFLFVILATVPGMLTLLFIPLDEPGGDLERQKPVTT